MTSPAIVSRSSHLVIPERLFQELDVPIDLSRERANSHVLFWPHEFLRLIEAYHVCNRPFNLSFFQTLQKIMQVTSPILLAHSDQLWTPVYTSLERYRFPARVIANTLVSCGILWQGFNLSKYVADAFLGDEEASISWTAFSITSLMCGLGYGIHRMISLVEDRTTTASFVEEFFTNLFEIVDAGLTGSKQLETDLNVFYDHWKEFFPTSHRANDPSLTDLFNQYVKHPSVRHRFF